jgi:cobalt-zinc-cadmium efflux system membrane fusion protein
MLVMLGCSPNNDASENKNATPTNVVLTQAQRQNIRLVTVTNVAFHRSVETTGVVDFDNDQATSVLAPISGPVARLLVSPGELVKKGQVLATVDSPDYAAAVGAYRKAIVAAAAARRLADMDKDLLQHNGVAQKEADQAESDAVSAEADRESARQALVALDIDPAHVAAAARGGATMHVEGSIRAPLAGTLVERLITPGQLLQAGTTPCFTIANLSRVWVMAQVFGSDLSNVSVGDTAEIDTGVAQQKMSGRVDNIGAEIDPDTRSVAVRVAVDNPTGQLRKQMYVRVRIQSHAQNTGMLVPVSSVLRDDENLPFVYTAQSDGSFARQHVTLGDRAGDDYGITGLRPGARVVADGALFVQFMQDQ